MIYTTITTTQVLYAALGMGVLADLFAIAVLAVVLHHMRGPRR